VTGTRERCYIATMATDKTFIESVLEKLQPLEITAKPMFGDYGLYYQGKNFALVCDNTLSVKITSAGAAIAGRVAQGSPYDGAKSAYRISSAKLNDRDWIISLVKVTSEVLPLPKKKK
jgi:TfoX/Sxy family transcriptional regulator of competence genes